MKKILLILMIMPCLSFANEENIGICTDVANGAETIAVFRDRGISLSRVLNAYDEGSEGVGDLFIAISTDVYRRTYLTPAKLNSKWMLKCLGDFENKVKPVNLPKEGK